MIRGAVFDLDGTLLDSMPIWTDAGARYLASLGVQAEPGLGNTLFPMTVPEGAAYLKRVYRLPLSEEAVAAGVRGLVTDFYVNLAPLKPGVLPFLAGLKSRGVRLAVATVTDRRCTEAALERTGALPYFSAVLTADETGAGKDRPDLYLRAAEAMHTAPAETLVFEDALHAARTAAAAGFPVAGVFDDSSRAEQDKLRRTCRYYLSGFTDFSAFAADAL